jgi:hypothetical protein
MEKEIVLVAYYLCAGPCCGEVRITSGDKRNNIIQTKIVTEDYIDGTTILHKRRKEKSAF